MASKDDKAPSITFYTKEQTQCPICNAKFKQEKVMSGGGLSSPEALPTN
ncbi:MAG TPA: DUF2225 domain-containing protein [Treponemataceae bacterium]|nr:DUF2225 domain-containing protein [Treponemataceae bacterium]